MRIVFTLLAVALALVVPSVAQATSLAYIENGEVWVASLDGATKVRLASPVVNANGATEKWLAVAASDGGRIVAARNVPGKNAGFSWFKAWEPDGTSTVEGPLNAPSAWAVAVYPLGFDITADGQHMVYGYSNSSGSTFVQGTYVRPVTSSPLPPIDLPGEAEPTLFGSRVIAHAGSTVTVQDASSTYSTSFANWLSVPPSVNVHRTDVAANGKLAAAELEQRENGTQTLGEIAVLALQGVGEALPTPAPVDCLLPVTGFAKDVSLSQDARFVAWTDDEGLKVAGTPATADDPCVLTSPPVVIAAGGTSASIGGGDVAAFLPPPTPPTPTLSAPHARGGTATPVSVTNPGAPSLTLPAKVTAKALTSGGLSLKVRVGAAGRITLSASVLAKVVGRQGKPVVVATGKATAKAKGNITVKVKLNATGRKFAKKLKGSKLTLKITQGGRTSTKTVKLG